MTATLTVTITDVVTVTNGQRVPIVMSTPVADESDSTRMRDSYQVTYDTIEEEGTTSTTFSEVTVPEKSRFGHRIKFRAVFTFQPLSGSPPPDPPRVGDVDADHEKITLTATSGDITTGDNSPTITITDHHASLHAKCPMNSRYA